MERQRTANLIMVSMLAALALLLAGCMDASLSQSGGTASSGISLQNVPDDVGEVTVTVSGPGMGTIEKTLESGSGELVFEVEVGSDREFAAEAGAYKASVVRDVPPGGVNVTLRFSRDVIMFTADFESSGPDVYLVAPEGSGLTQVTETSDIYYARYTPDGSQIVFLRGGDPESEAVDLYVMDAHDPATMELLDSEISPAGDSDTNPFEPGFLKVSPDGSAVAYRSSDDGQIHTVSLSDGSSTKLTEFYPTDTDPTPSWSWLWSESGNKIVYPGYNGETMGLWVVDAAGNNEVELISDPYITSVDWLGDGGDEVVYYSDITETPTLYQFSTETETELANKELSADVEYASFVQSAPSGNAVSFAGTVEVGSQQLFTISVDSSGFGGTTQLTDDTSWQDLAPFAFWSPDGGRIGGYVAESTESGELDIVYGNSDEPGSFQSIGDSNVTELIRDWSPTGESLVYLQQDLETSQSRLFAEDLSSGGAAEPVDLLNTWAMIGSVQWRP